MNEYKELDDINPIKHVSNRVHIQIVNQNTNCTYRNTNCTYRNIKITRDFRKVLKSITIDEDDKATVIRLGDKAYKNRSTNSICFTNRKSSKDNDADCIDCHNILYSHEGSIKSDLVIYNDRSTPSYRLDITGQYKSYYSTAPHRDESGGLKIISNRDHSGFKASKFYMQLNDGHKIIYELGKTATNCYTMIYDECNISLDIAISIAISVLRKTGRWFI